MGISIAAYSTHLSLILIYPLTFCYIYSAKCYACVFETVNGTDSRDLYSLNYENKFWTSSCANTENGLSQPSNVPTTVLRCRIRIRIHILVCMKKNQFAGLVQYNSRMCHLGEIDFFLSENLKWHTILPFYIKDK